MNWKRNLTARAAATMTAVLVAVSCPASGAVAGPGLGGAPGHEAGRGEAGHGGRPGTPVRLRADDLIDPIGIENSAPELSWEFSAGGTNAQQTAYQVRVASNRTALRVGHADLWDSGKVRSAVNQGVPYGGRELGSRAAAYWQVRVWNHNRKVSAWSDPASWEVGLQGARDWQGEWIGNPAWEERVARPMVLDIKKQTARYVRVDTSFLAGSTQDPFDADQKLRLQLAEVEVIDSADPATNLARGAQVTASESDPVDGSFAPSYLTDGQPLSDQAPRGYSSPEHSSGDVQSDPISLTLDLGEVRTFDRVLVYPRSDLQDQFHRTANYPRDLTVSVPIAGSDEFQGVRTFTRQEPPTARRTNPAALPVFARSFTPDAPVRKARLSITGTGIYAARLNGKPVSDAVLEPPNTDFDQQLVASTYDVTDLLGRGENRLTAELGSGMGSVSRPASNRFQYLGNDYGPPRIIAQLELTLADGSRQVIGTDGSWKTSLGPTTFANWYGGEDYDQRRDPTGWRSPGGDLAGWADAVTTGAPAGDPEIVGRTAPPIKQVDAIRAVSVTNPEAGTYIVDFGVNVAGWPQLTVDGPAGTEVRMYPAEQLDKDGTVLQTGWSGRNRVWDQVTLAGSGPLTWHPQFNYHGFRYLELTGLTQAPAPSDFTALVLRTADETAGSFSSSDALLNDIHSIQNRAMQSNMYSVFTDCPHREKLGWLDQINLVYDSLSKNYDVEAHYRKVLRDMADAQTASGLIPDITPEYTEFVEWNRGYRDDPNWGGSIILAPWQLYRTYGNTDMMRTYYPTMQRYLDYVSSRADGHLVGEGLGDWIALDTDTPLTLVGTQAYYRLTTTLAEVAEKLGKHDDAARYSNLAGQIRDAFNASFFDSATGDYGPGNQASNGLALDAGLVPDGDEERVLTNLVDSIREDDNHLQVGEVALPAILKTLAAHGRDDVIYDLATQTSFPSYGYLVKTGSTSMPEAWTGMTKSGAQNHYMLAALDDWFWSGLGGIEQTDDSVAWHDLTISPAVVGDLRSAEASYRTPQGLVSTSWTRSSTKLQLDVEVPGNTTATIRVPLDRLGGASAKVTATGGLKPIRVDDRYATFAAGSGSWTFRATARH